MDTQTFKTATMQIIYDVTAYLQAGNWSEEMEGDIRVLRLLSMSLTAALQNASLPPPPKQITPLIPQQSQMPPLPQAPTVSQPTLGRQ